jgi:hypothetical protein
VEVAGSREGDRKLETEGEGRKEYYGGNIIRGSFKHKGKKDKGEEGIKHGKIEHTLRKG